MKTLLTIFVIGLSQSISAQITKKIVPTFYFPGAHFNQKIGGQGSVIGINVFGDIVKEKYNNGVYVNRKGEYILISFYHHFPNKNNRLNSQSIEIQLPFYKELGLAFFLGAGIEVRHYDFKSYELSPKLYLNTVLVGVFAQYNCMVYKELNRDLPKFAFGLSINTNYLIGLVGIALDNGPKL